MSDWTAEELNKIGTTDEVQIAPSRPDGTLHPYTTIWIVRSDDDLYVRSYRGRAGGWFRHALQSHEGRVRADGVERDVTFREAPDTDNDLIDRAYRTKYGGYGRTYVDPMVSPTATATTLRIDPR